MAIEHKRLFRSGVFVSNICLGTMNFGWHTAQEESFKIMDRALELGINFFDTADVYGRGGEQGDTEEILGRWFAQGGGRRDAVILATKVFNPVKRKANLAEPNTDGRSLSAYKIRKHSEGSLKRLQTDHIDLYQMHHVDRDCPWDETWQAFEQLGNQGKVVYVGSSIFAGWDIATAPAAVALAWLLHNPIVTAPIIGPRTIGQLESALRATEITLAEETLKRLDEIFPGPGGEAPEAYAW